MNEQSQLSQDALKSGEDETVWYSWGWNEHGQLGVGGVHDARDPAAVPTPDGYRATGVHAGAGFTLVSGWQEDTDCIKLIQVSHNSHPCLVLLVDLCI